MGRFGLKPLIPDPDRKAPKFGVCDLESAKGWINFLVMGLAWKDFDEDGTLIEKRYHYFLTMAEFAEYLFSGEYPHDTIFAHFGGRYDFSFILKEYYFRGDKYHIGKLLPRGSGLLCFDVSTFTLEKDVPEWCNYEKDVLGKTDDGFFKIRDKTINFRDSSAMMPFGLASLTENFGVDHKKQEIDYDAITEVTPELLEYLEYDCWGLYECIEQYFNWPIIKQAGPAMTVASQSLRIFRTFLTREIPSLSPRVDAFVRSSYFGGRTEIFKPFFEQCEDSKMLKSYDVNSLYPFIMKDLQFPGGFKYETTFYKEDEMGFYDMEITMPNMYVPPLAIRFEGMEDRLIFPVGTFRGVWSTMEINYALTLGAKINKVYRGMVFHNIGKIFTTYIEHLYALRKASKKNSVDNVLCKLIMNSSYGRFGLNADREQLILDQGQAGVTPFMDIPVSEDGKRIIRIAKQEITLENSFSNVAIAAWVTSGARIHMHKQILNAPEDMYYMDSVTEDRMVMVMNEDKSISVKSMGELWSMVKVKSRRGTKEIGELELKTLAFNCERNNWEWKKIEKIIRHATDKQIVTTRSNKGASRTTEDHSFINDRNERLKPSDVSELFSPKSLKVPKQRRLKSIDLWVYINDREGLKCDKKWIWATHEGSKAKRPYTPIKIKRMYSGKDLEDFCALAGYFVSEGSTSIHGRQMFSISSEKKEFQEYLREFLNRSIQGAQVNHIKSSNKDDCWALRAGNKTMAIVFSRLFGQGSFNKRLPDFVFNLNDKCHKILIDSLILGDGCVLFPKTYSEEYKSKNFSYSSNSFVLINQLCALLSFDGQCYSIQYRPSKNNWNIQTSSNNRNKKPKIETSDYVGAVYDLQVEGHNNFFDCEGMIGLHNTDSLKTTHTYDRNDADLGKLKLEYKSKRACFLLPKTYIEETTSPLFKVFNPKGKPEELKSVKKIVMKGFDKKKISHFTPEDFASCLEGDMKRLASMNPEKFAPLRTAVGKNEFLMLLKESPRQIRTRYNKRKVVKRDWAQVYDTEPLRIKDGEITNIDKGILKKWKPLTTNDMIEIENEVIQKWIDEAKEKAERY